MCGLKRSGRRGRRPRPRRRKRRKIGEVGLSLRAEERGKAVLRDAEARGERKLRVLVGVPGFLEPWNVFDDSRIESLELRWEMDALLQLGRKVSEAIPGTSPSSNYSG